MALPALLRRLLHRLPRPLRHALRRAHSLRVVRNFRPSDWDYHALAVGCLRTGDCAVDAGANIGYVSRLLADRVGPDGRVHAFEPVAETHDIHARCMKALGLTQVLSRNEGLSDHSGAAAMTVPLYENGGRNFYESRITEGPGEAVRLVSLDEALADETRPVRFIKVDVEGHELEALRGARATLARHRPVLLVEIHGDPADAAGNAAKVFTELRAQGYAPGLWRDGAWRPWQPGQTSVDYVFRPGGEGLA